MRLRRILSSLLAAVMLLGMIATSSVTMASDMPFKDVLTVKEGGWYYDYVKYVYENKLMSGTSGTTFEPEGYMTRAMFVTVLGRLAGVKDAVKDEADFVPDTFTDTDDTMWYAAHTAWAQKNSIILGNNGKFNPDDNITREEAVAIIIRYIKLTGVLMTISGDAPAKFTDADKIAEWFTVEIDTMRRYGIVTGNTDGTFAPKGNLTRAQGATILRRLDEKLKELTYEEPYSPDYSVEGKEYLVMGAWDINYAALGTNTSGQKVEVGEDFAYFTYNDKGSAAAQNWMNLTERDVHIEDYPFVRVGYVGNGNFTLKFADDSFDLYSVSAVDCETDAFGIKSVVANVHDSDGYTEGVLKRVMCFESAGDVDIVYAAFFKNEADASAFDFAAIADDYKEYCGVDVDYVADADISVAEGYLAEADKRIDEIVNSESALTPAQVEKLGGTCYYVSSINGDDNNDGKSPETAWKTPLALWNVKKAGFNIYYTAKIKSGDGVFFERGSVFDASNELYHFEGSGDSVLVGAPGVYYGAYGKGAKPVFSNSIDYYGQTPWIEVEENIWRLDYDFMLPKTAQKAESYSYHDVGNVVLTDNEGNTGWGIRITIDCDEGSGRLGKGNRTISLGYVTNGFGDVYDVQSRDTEKISDVLKNNLEFFHEIKDGEITSSLYMYYDGDLNKDFSSIVVAKKGDIFSASGMKMADNLSFEYGGSGGIAAVHAVDMVIQNCTFKWIGGSLNGDGDIRFGNAFQNWEGCDGVFFRNNYIYQVYDTGVTTQGYRGVMKDFYATDNVMSHTIMPVELFNYSNTVEEGYMANHGYSDNYLLYTGYGFGSTRDDRSYRSPFFSWGGCKTGMINVNFNENICVYSANHGAFGGSMFTQGDTNNGINLADNIYITSKVTCNMARVYHDSKFGFNLTPFNVGTSFVPKSDRGVGYFKNLGIELGSKFYNVDEYIVEGEEKGAYVDRNVTGW